MCFGFVVLTLILTALICFHAKMRSLYCTAPLLFTKPTTRLMKTLFSLSVSLPFPAFSIYTHVWPKALRLWRESELPLWAHSGTGASTGRSWSWYLHKPRGVQLQHRCLWQLKLVTGMGRCFKAFYTKSALFESSSILSVSCRRNLKTPRWSHWSLVLESRFDVHRQSFWTDSHLQFISLNTI